MIARITVPKPCGKCVLRSVKSREVFDHLLPITAPTITPRSGELACTMFPSGRGVVEGFALEVEAFSVDAVDLTP